MIFLRLKKKIFQAEDLVNEFIFNKEKIVFKLELGKNLKRKLIEIINNREV